MIDTVATDVCAIQIPHDGIVETALTLAQGETEEPAAVLTRLDNYLQAHPRLQVTRLAVFGLDAAAHRPRTESWDWPVTWIEHGGDGLSKLAGVQIHGVEGAAVRRLRVGDRVLGSVYEDSQARYCVLGGILPSAPQAPKPRQARECFENLEAALHLAGMSFFDVARTWLYLDDILGWYGEFNQVRTAYFGEHGIFKGLVPASTGVSGVNSAGAALVADCLAMKLKPGQATLRPIPSPLQCPALEYGSSFSRAVELATGDHRRLWISGTASIAVGGETDYVGQMDSQVDLTLKVVHAILKSRQMDWDDVCRGIAYFRQAEDVGSFTRLCAIHGVPTAPILCAENYICRDDLLFELELDAAVTSGASAGR